MGKHSNDVGVVRSIIQLSDIKRATTERDLPRTQHECEWKVCTSRCIAESKTTGTAVLQIKIDYAEAFLPAIFFVFVKQKEARLMHVRQWKDSL